MRRVIHPAIYAVYDGPNPTSSIAPFRRRLSDRGWEIPLEFSHGAFRFGHAMVRPEYQINDLSLHDLNITLEKSSVTTPQTCARRDLDGAMVALFRDQRIDAELQPPHRTPSQRRAGQ
jgi:hypothetical protein